MTALKIIALLWCALCWLRATVLAIDDWKEISKDVPANIRWVSLLLVVVVILFAPLFQVIKVFAKLTR